MKPKQPYPERRINRMTRLLAVAAFAWTQSTAAADATDWNLVEEADGTLRITPPTGEPAGQPISNVLTVRGWEITKEKDGSLTLIRKTGPAETTDAKEPARVAPASTPSAIYPDAAARMEAAGWTLEKAEDGSVLLYPPRQDAPLNDPAAPAQATEDDDESPASQPLLDNASVQKLISKGWGVDNAPDGSVLLFPPGKPATVIESKPEPKEPPQTVLATLDDEILLTSLESRGWTVAREEDGSVLLFPKGSRQADKTSSSSDGILTSMLEEGSLTLPVDTWSEARAIADAWLDASELDGLSVGRVRKLHRVYIVSILEAKPPHGLRHQIAIKTANGDVLLLD